uniref:hypothetical protein n=1 Tax=Citrobacter freundii TaxID=546 RepID=UPI001BCE930E
MGSCAAPSAKGDDKFITTDYLQQCPNFHHNEIRSLPGVFFELSRFSGAKEAKMEKKITGYTTVDIS